MAWTVAPVAIAYCPACGAELGARSTHEGDRPYCQACELTVYRNPVPMARATVVDGDALLLIEMGQGPDEGSWALAGGHCLPEEPPAVTAAREFREETGLAIDASALTLVGDGHLTFDDGATMVSLNYAAPRSAADGEVSAGDDAAAARWWSRAEIRSDPPLARASGRAQLLATIDRFGG